MTKHWKISKLTLPYTYCRIDKVMKYSWKYDSLFSSLDINWAVVFAIDLCSSTWPSTKQLIAAACDDDEWALWAAFPDTLEVEVNEGSSAELDYVTDLFKALYREWRKSIGPLTSMVIKWLKACLTTFFFHTCYSRRLWFCSRLQSEQLTVQISRAPEAKKQNTVKAIIITNILPANNLESKGTIAIENVFSFGQKLSCPPHFVAITTSTLFGILSHKILGWICSILCPIILKSIGENWCWLMRRPGNAIVIPISPNVG